MLRKNLLSISVAAVIMYLSLTSSDSFSRFKVPPIPNFDKIVHASMYFALMLSMIFENRKILVTGKSYLFLATIPFIYGVLMELLQMMFTADRQADIFDVLFNLAGIAFAVFFWKLMKRFLPGDVK
jgi:VanZ family protein